VTNQIAIRKKRASLGQDGRAIFERCRASCHSSHDGEFCEAESILSRTRSSFAPAEADASILDGIEEPPLLLPIVRQIPGKHDEPCGRQLDGLLADQDRANDFRREIRETHEPRHIIAPHAKPRRHGVDAVITARKEHVAGCDRPGDQGGKARR